MWMIWEWVDAPFRALQAATMDEITSFWTRWTSCYPTYCMLPRWHWPVSPSGKVTLLVLQLTVPLTTHINHSYNNRAHVRISEVIVSKYRVFQKSPFTIWKDDFPNPFTLARLASPSFPLLIPRPFRSHFLFSSSEASIHFPILTAVLAFSSIDPLDKDDCSTCIPKL